MPVTRCLFPLLIAHRVLQEARPQLLSVVLTSLEVGGHFMLRVRHTQVAGSSLQRVDSTHRAGHSTKTRRVCEHRTRTFASLMSSLTSGRAGAAVSTASRVDALLLATATSACKVRGGSADSHYDAFSSQTARHLLRRNQRGAPGAVCHVTSEERLVCVSFPSAFCVYSCSSPPQDDCRQH
jgi:hypothetical protein